MSKSYAAGYTAIPNEIKAFVRADTRWIWAMPLVDWWYQKTRGDTCRQTYDQAREHLATLPYARTRQGTVPSRWAIARFMDLMRQKGYLSTDRKQNRANGARFGCCVFNLVRWVITALRLKPVLHGSATRSSPMKEPSKPTPVLHGSATPVKDDPLSEENKSYARQLRARFGLKPNKTAQQGA